MAERRLLLWLLSVSSLVSLTSAAAVLSPNFSFYPPNSISCLNKAVVVSKCTGSSTKDLNHCLCTNTGNWVILTATCLGREDPADITRVWTTMGGACADSNTPLQISQTDFESAAEGAMPTLTASPPPPDSTGPTASGSTPPPAPLTTSADSPPPPPPPPPSSSTSPATASQLSSLTEDNSAAGPKGLSTGATAGVAIGASLGGIAAVAFIVTFLVRKKRKINYDPMKTRKPPSDHNPYSSKIIIPVGSTPRLPGMMPMGQAGIYRSNTWESSTGGPPGSLVMSSFSNLGSGTINGNPNIYQSLNQYGNPDARMQSQDQLFNSLLADTQRFTSEPYSATTPPTEEIGATPSHTLDNIYEMDGATDRLSRQSYFYHRSQHRKSGPLEAQPEHEAETPGTL